MKFSVIIADPPYKFSDQLSMSDIKRGASSQYKIMTTKDICDLKVKALSEKNALLALWTPASLLEDGLKVMKAWGFVQKQIVCWQKTKKHFNPKEDELDDCLGFGMGRLFRGCNEFALIGTKGKIASEVKNHSQRNAFFGINEGHSIKPDTLHKRLDIMFPNTNKLEIFGRREYKNWTVIGNQSPETEDEDVIVSIDRLIVK